MLTGCKKMYYKEYTHIRQQIPKYQGFSLRKFTNLLPKQTKKTQKYPPTKYSSIALRISLFPRMIPTAPQLTEFHRLIEKPDVC